MQTTRQLKTYGKQNETNTSKTVKIPEHLLTQTIQDFNPKTMLPKTKSQNLIAPTQEQEWILWHFQSLNPTVREEDNPEAHRQQPTSDTNLNDHQITNPLTIPIAGGLS